MKSSKALCALGLVYLLGLASACSMKVNPGDSAEDLPAPSSIAEAQWAETTLSNRGVRLHAKCLKQEIQNQRRAEFRVPELEEIKTDFSGSFTLYQLRNVPENLAQAREIVFIQPKVFVYGTAQGGNVLQLTSDNGRLVSLTFPIAFVDGLKQSLPSHEGVAAVSIPDALRIPDVARLREDLRAKLGHDPRLMALPTCPRQMTMLHVRGTETRRLPVVPTVSIRNRCPVNEFFTATVTSSGSEIYDLVQNGISDGLGVQIQADFQVQYREPVGFYSLELDPAALYQEFREKFIRAPFGQTDDPTIYLAFQLIKPLEESLRRAVESTGAGAGWVPYFQGVQHFLDTFFDRVDPEGGCHGPNRCFRLKPEVVFHFDEPLELQWIESSLLASSRMIPTVTFVKGLAESYPIRLSSERNLPMLGVIPTKEACESLKGNLPGCDGFSCEKFSDNVYCRNGRTKNPIHHFQVFPGAKIRLNFNRITEWGYELPAPREDTSPEQKRGTVRCADGETITGACEEYEEFCPVDKVPFCNNQKDECEQEHKIFEDQCKTERVTERSCGFLGLGSCSEVLKENRVTCEKTEVGKECLKWKSTCEGEVTMVCPKSERRCKKLATTCHQWTTEFYSRYTYSEPWVRPRAIDLSTGATLEQLWDGLDLEFSWLGEDGKTWERVTCPLKAFPNRIEGYSITATLDNQEASDCQPFNKWNVQQGRWPQIALVNHINYEKPYLCGSLEWTRSISADPQSKEKVIDRLSYRCPERPDLASSNKPIVNTYQPIVDLEGTISILGHSMDTVSSMPRP